MKNQIFYRFLALILVFSSVLPFFSQIAFAKDDNTYDRFLTSYQNLLDAQDESAYYGQMELTLGEKTLTVDGAQQALDVAPELDLDANRTMLPIRAIAETVGANVCWDPGEKTAHITSAFGDDISCTIGLDEMTVNGECFDLDVSPYIKDGRTYLPVRAVAEALQMDVDWTQETQTVTLSSPFQTCRLLVLADASFRASKYGADSTLYDGYGMWILQYADPQETMLAMEMLESEGYTVEPDQYCSINVESGVGTPTRSFTPGQSWGVTDCGFDQFLSACSDYFSYTPKQEVVAVLDTGVDASHPFLRGHLLEGKDILERNQLNMDWDHGTHVAGIVVACVGSAPVKILPIRVIYGGVGLPGERHGSTYSNIVRSGILYAMEHHADVITMSLGIRHSPAVDDAVQRAISNGILVTMSSGNDGREAPEHCPSHVNVAGAMEIGAANRDHTKWKDSNFGNNVDLIAPGVEVYSSFSGGQYGPDTGTSMATPHVAAAAVLLDLAWDKELSPAELEQKVRAASTYGRWYNKQVGYGFLDLTKAELPESLTQDPNRSQKPGVVKYSFDVSALDLTIGESAAVRVTAYYADGSTKDVTNEAGLRSSKTSVAEVSAGIVTAKSVGTTMVYITNAEDSVSTTPVVIVNVLSKPPGIVSYHYSNTTLNLNVGESATVMVMATCSDGSTRDVTNEVGLKSSDNSIATVSDGKVTARDVGIAKIDMTNAEQSAQRPAPITVNVFPAERRIVSYRYNVGSLDLKVGETASVKVTAVYSDGTTKDVTGSAGLTVKDPSVAAISGGTVTGRSVGTTTIFMTTATESVSIPVPITVKVSPKEASVVSYQYNVNSLNLKVGETATVKVTAVYSDGTTKDVTNRVGLTITDSYIAGISGGTVIGKSVGTTTITMTTATESVSIPPPIAVRVNANYKPGGLIFQEITVKPNADVSSYYVSAEKGDTLVLAITVDTTETAVGDDKFILWTALSEGYSWNQIGACYVDGGTIALVPLVLNLEKNERLGVALFHSDKYYSGASISDNFIFVTVKDG